MGGCCSSNKPKSNVSPTDQYDVVRQNSESMPGMPADQQFIETLKEIPLLSSISEADQHKLAKHLVERTYSAGDDLMVQGGVGTEFFIIASGKCKVIIKNDDDEEVEIAQLSDGDYCGEQALLKDARRGATVRAMSDKVKCLILNQSAFKEIISGGNNKIRFANRDAKRNAISAEKMKQMQEEEKKENKNVEGLEDDKLKWLLSCVDDNILFSHLDDKQRKIVCSEMYQKDVKPDEFLIVQGEEGNTFYVVEEGEFIITVKDIGQVDTLNKGRCVGELALLYNAPRAASVKCVSSNGGKLWCVDRKSFRAAIMKVAEKATNENIEFLRKCELLQPLLSSELQLVDQALELKCFNKDEIIFKLGDEGDRFYIIKSGAIEGKAKDGTIFKLSAGAFFGERALLTNEPRAATITTTSDKLECLTLTREDFIILLGPLEDIMERNMEEYEKPEELRKIMGGDIKQDKTDNTICKLEEFKTIGILGRGAFGVVKLVEDPNTNKSYALKAIRKNQVVELGQQSHILNEKKVMQMMDNQFLVNLKGTYKDKWRVYFLLEVCLGGELFTILRKMRSFDEPTARFYTSCVIEAFDYMHAKDIIYRDLKPENLVLTSNGYLKVTDFGFAKFVVNKTFTLCGTPDYLAPEIVTGQGHGRAVDWWTLGVLIYEMLASFPPFFDDEPIETYRKIIRGRVKFPRYFTPEARDLIRGLLRNKPVKRLGILKGGADNIRKHGWFYGFDWDKLYKGSLKAPIKNNVRNNKDLSNFVNSEEDEEDEPALPVAPQDDFGDEF